MQFTKAQIANIEEMAFNQCHIRTIADVIGVDDHTIKRHFSAHLTKKRAEGRAALHKDQMEMAKHIPTMSIFLGKNYLDQKDERSQEVNIPQLAKPITLAIVKQRILKLEKSSDGIDYKSINGSRD